MPCSASWWKRNKSAPSVTTHAHFQAPCSASHPRAHRQTQPTFVPRVVRLLWRFAILVNRPIGVGVPWLTWQIPWHPLRYFATLRAFATLWIDFFGPALSSELSRSLPLTHRTQTSLFLSDIQAWAPVQTWPKAPRERCPVTCLQRPKHPV